MRRSFWLHVVFCTLGILTLWVALEAWGVLRVTLPSRWMYLMAFLPGLLLASLTSRLGMSAIAASPQIPTRETLSPFPPAREDLPTIQPYPTRDEGIPPPPLEPSVAEVSGPLERGPLDEERFCALAESLAEGVTLVEGGQVVYYNRRAVEIFGEVPPHGLRERLLRFAAPGEHPRLLEALEQAEHSGELPAELEYRVLNAESGLRYVRERYIPLRSAGRERVLILTGDISGEKAALQTLEQAVNERTRELSTLLEISHRIASTLELEPLLHLVLDQMQSVVPYSGATLFALEEGQLRPLAYQVPRFSPPRQSLSLPLEEGNPYSQVVLESRPIILTNVGGDTLLLRAWRHCEPQGAPPLFDHASSWMGIPLVVHERVIGLLELCHNRIGYFTQRHAHLAMSIANQVAVAIENAHLYGQARDLAVLEERHRLARELHDSVTQLLYGIGLYAAAARRSLNNGNFSQVTVDLEEIKSNALQALQEMRLLILELDPPLLQKAGLSAALKASLEAIENRAGLQTELILEEVRSLPKNLEWELYRIAMEALTNLVRHAHAQKVSVHVRCGDGWVWMDICDDGVGFEPAQAWQSGGMGLRSMEQRAAQIRGRLQIETRPGAGTRIHVEAPIFGASLTSVPR